MSLSNNMRKILRCHMVVVFLFTQELFIAGPTLVPIVENSDPTKWSAIDTLLYATAVGLIIVIFILCGKLCYRALSRYSKKFIPKRKSTVTFQQPLSYNTLDELSSSESEDKFDVRNYSENSALMGTSDTSPEEK